MKTLFESILLLVVLLISTQATTYAQNGNNPSPLPATPTVSMTISIEI